MSVKGRCDVCGEGVKHHGYPLQHAYTCAADDALRELRKERFAGCVDDVGYRTYDRDARMYRWHPFEPLVSACAYPECFRGPHDRPWVRVPVGDDAWFHEYVPPNGAELLDRMRRRRVLRLARRQRALGAWRIVRAVFHVYPDDQDSDRDSDPYAVNGLYEDLPSAVRGAADALGVGRLVEPVRVGRNRWYLSNGDTAAYIKRRPVFERVKS